MTVFCFGDIVSKSSIREGKRPIMRMQSTSSRSMSLWASASAGKNSLPPLDATGIAPGDPNRQVQTVEAPAQLPPPAPAPAFSRIPKEGFCGQGSYEV